MVLRAEHLMRSADYLEQALSAINTLDDKQGPMFEIYRVAAIKFFELTLESSGKLLRKALKLYDENPGKIDHLVFNEVLRHAGKHGLLSSAQIERWLTYRVNRNNTAHDYGVEFVSHTLTLLPQYLIDLRDLAKALQVVFNAST